MALARVEGNIHTTDIVDADVKSGADIAASKLEHYYQPTYAQNGNAAAATVVLHYVQGATGTLLAVKIGSVAAATGDSTATIDIKKNGTTVLSAVVVLDNANTAYIAESGTISVPALVVGDVLTAVITVSAGSGTLPTGLYITPKIREKAA